MFVRVSIFQNEIGFSSSSNGAFLSQVWFIRCGERAPGSQKPRSGVTGVPASLISSSTLSLLHHSLVRFLYKTRQDIWVHISLKKGLHIPLRDIVLQLLFIWESSEKANDTMLDPGEPKPSWWAHIWDERILCSGVEHASYTPTFIFFVHTSVTLETQSRDRKSVV